MEGKNLGYGTTNINDPHASSVFLLDYGRLGIKDFFSQAHLDSIRGLVSSYVHDFLDKYGCVPRNFEFERNFGNKIGSFILRESDNLDSVSSQKAYFSSKLGIDLQVVDKESILNGSDGLKLELYPDSKISIVELGEAITDFISDFIINNEIKYTELERLLGKDYMSLKPKLNHSLNEFTDHRMLFSINRRFGGRIFFSDLSPIDPKFFQNLLLFLDERFGNRETKFKLG